MLVSMFDLWLDPSTATLERKLEHVVSSETGTQERNPGGKLLFHGQENGSPEWETGFPQVPANRKRKLREGTLLSTGTS